MRLDFKLIDYHNVLIKPIGYLISRDENGFEVRDALLVDAHVAIADWNAPDAECLVRSKVPVIFAVNRQFFAKEVQRHGRSIYLHNQVG